MLKDINIREFHQEIENILSNTDEHSCVYQETIHYDEMAKKVVIWLDENYEIVKCKS